MPETKIDFTSLCIQHNVNVRMWKLDEKNLLDLTVSFSFMMPICWLYVVQMMFENVGKELASFQRKYKANYAFAFLAMRLNVNKQMAIHLFSHQSNIVFGSYLSILEMLYDLIFVIRQTFNVTISFNSLCPCHFRHFLRIIQFSSWHLYIIF